MITSVLVENYNHCFVFQVWHDRIKRTLRESEKDNEFIYHELVPSLDNLAATGRAALAKPLPLSKPASSNFTDLFAKLVPMAVHQALQAYDSRKAEIINFEVGRLREGTQLMNRCVRRCLHGRRVTFLEGAPS